MKSPRRPKVPSSVGSRNALPPGLARNSRPQFLAGSCPYRTRAHAAEVGLSHVGPQYLFGWKYEKKSLRSARSKGVVHAQPRDSCPATPNLPAHDARPNSRRSDRRSRPRTDTGRRRTGRFPSREMWALRNTSPHVPRKPQVRAGKWLGIDRPFARFTKTSAVEVIWWRERREGSNPPCRG